VDQHHGLIDRSAFAFDHMENPIFTHATPVGAAPALPVAKPAASPAGGMSK
jgi:hypothetical protein